MKYAAEMLDVFESDPSKDFRTIEIIKIISKNIPLAGKEKHRLRKGVSRVISLLAESGLILVKPPRFSRGGYALYRLKVRH